MGTTLMGTIIPTAITTDHITATLTTGLTIGMGGTDIIATTATIITIGTNLI